MSSPGAQPSPSKRVQPDGRYKRSVAEVAEAFRAARDARQNCTLLVGAGCSVTAGIPAGSGFSAKIKEDYPQAYARARAGCEGGEPGYGHCMAQLTRAQQKRLIEHYVREAKINWAHLAIAAIMAAGYVDRVLTTNFDNLIVRAAALLNLFPGVYDMTMYRGAGGVGPAQLLWNDLPPHAVFHLHGQSTGFRLLSTEAELNVHAPHVGDCFGFEDGGRPWIVAGYSGENDPIFERHIAGQPHFDDGLFWVSYQKDGVPPNVCDSLFQGSKDAYHVPGHDADGFFILLAQALQVFPPQLFVQPFTHLRSLMDTISDYSPPGSDAGPFAFVNTKLRLEEAISKYEATVTAEETLAGVGELPSLEEPSRPEPQGLKATQLLLGGDYEGVVRLYEEAPPALQLELRDAAASAYFSLGYRQQDRAEGATGAEALDLYRSAEDSYRRAAEAKPDYYGALNNWGLTLYERARLSEGTEATALLLAAEEKYARAAEAKPDDHKTLNNWGSALHERARRTGGAEAVALLLEAEEKYARAAEAKPDYEAALNNWGLLFQERGRSHSGPDQDRLFEAAQAKYQAAERLKPGSAAYNLACLAALSGHADECREWLESARVHGGLPSLTHVREDADLDGMRNEPWFEGFIEKAYGTSENPA